MRNSLGWLAFLEDTEAQARAVLDRSDLEESPPESLLCRFWCERGTARYLMGMKSEAVAAFRGAIHWGWCYQQPTPPGGWRVSSLDCGTPSEGMYLQVRTACAAALADDAEQIRKQLQFALVNADQVVEKDVERSDPEAHGRALLWRAFAQLGGVGEFSKRTLDDLVVAKDLLEGALVDVGRVRYQEYVLIPQVLVAAAIQRLGGEADVPGALTRLVEGMNENTMRLQGWFYRLAFEKLLPECRSTAN